MHVLLIRLGLLATLALNSCSPVSVKFDYDRAVDFSKYQTYDWIEKQHPTNTLMEKSIRASIEKVMAARGYEKVTARRPDLVIVYHTNVQEKINVSAYGYGYWRRPDGVKQVDTLHYEEGTLVIDIVDPRMKQLVWRGWGSGALKNSGNTAENISEAVAKILNKFPPSE